MFESIEITLLGLRSQSSFLNLEDIRDWNGWPHWNFLSVASTRVQRWPNSKFNSVSFDMITKPFGIFWYWVSSSSLGNFGCLLNFNDFAWFSSAPRCTPIQINNTRLKLNTSRMPFFGVRSGGIGSQWHHVEQNGGTWNMACLAAEWSCSSEPWPIQRKYSTFLATAWMTS